MASDASDAADPMADADAAERLQDAPAPARSTKTPQDFLLGVIGRPVVVRLNSGIDYHGTLACLDGYMNIALEQTKEFVAGIEKNDYGDCFIRGNNVLYISAAK